jgi:hypothetical protein
VHRPPPVEAASVQEVVEWLGQPVVDYRVGVEVQPVEKHLIKLPPHRVAGLPVQLLWIL